MKKIALLLMLLFPLAGIAQDDIYYVPQKAKKVLVVKSNEESYFVDVDETASEVDEVVDEAYYIDNPDYLFDDYKYSTRIIRFRNPNRLLGSGVYWDLSYGYGVRDWLVYDNGYSIDIYPTAANPLFYVGGFTWGAVNYWNWYDYYNRSWNWYWDNRLWYNSYHWHGNHHWWNHHVHHIHTPNLAYRNTWKPVYRSVPTLGGLGRGDRNGRGGGYTAINSGNGGKREEKGSTIIRSQRPRRDISGKVVGSSVNGDNNKRGGSTTTVRTQRPGRNTSGAVVNSNNNGSDKRTDGTSTAMRKQRPSRNTSATVVGGNKNGNDRQQGGTSTAIRIQRPRRDVSGTAVGGNANKNNDKVNDNSVTSVRSQRPRRENSSVTNRGNGSSGKRSSSVSSSRSYDRPSSTGVSRSSGPGSSGGSRSSGSSRGGGGSRGGSRR